MKKYSCLICNTELTHQHYIAYEDYFCWAGDHGFTMRIINGPNPRLAKLTVSFEDNDEVICMKIHYDDKYTEVWKGAIKQRQLAHERPIRSRINQIVVPDFTDLAKLKNKIRTMLVFV